MINNDPRSIQLRIAKLQERLREKPRTRFEFLKDSSKVISISAFVISIVTTIYSWRKDELQTREVARRQFDSTMQQLVDRGFKEFEFTAKNRNEKNFGAIAGWFNAQSGLMANKVVQDLAAIDDASMFDYILVGNTLMKANQVSRATALFDKAIEIGQQKKKEHDQPYYKLIGIVEAKLFGEKLDLSLSDEQRIHDLGSAYVSLGQGLIGQSKTEDAAKAFENAIQLVGSYQSEDLKRNSIAFIQKTWAEAIVVLDCKSSLSHLQSAADNLPDAKKNADDADWQSIQYELGWGSTHCGSDGKLHGDAPVAGSPNVQTMPPASGGPIPNVAGTNILSGNDANRRGDMPPASQPNVKDAQASTPASVWPNPSGAGTNLPISQAPSRKKH